MTITTCTGKVPRRASIGKSVRPHGQRYSSKLVRRVMRSRRPSYSRTLEKFFASNRRARASHRRR